VRINEVIELSTPARPAAFALTSLLTVFSFTKTAADEQHMMTAQVFPLGKIVATPGALEALNESRQSPMEFLKRHAAGDWGVLGREDAQANEEALMHEARLISAYQTQLGVRLWIITEADRSSTCLLLPEED
jgi:hypothetical protein